MAASGDAVWLAPRLAEAVSEPVPDALGLGVVLCVDAPEGDLVRDLDACGRGGGAIEEGFGEVVPREGMWRHAPWPRRRS